MKKHIILSLILLGLLSVDVSVAMEENQIQETSKNRKGKRPPVNPEKPTTKKQKTVDVVVETSTFTKLFKKYAEKQSDQLFLEVFQEACKSRDFNNVVYNIADKDTIGSLDWFLHHAFIAGYTETINYMLNLDKFKENKDGVLRSFFPAIRNLDVLKVFLANQDYFQHLQKNDDIVQNLRDQLYDIGNKNYMEFTNIDAIQKNALINHLNAMLPKKPFWKTWFGF